MLNVFVNTWGNYNKNGAYLGEWVTLPMEQIDLENTLEKIAHNMKDHDPEFCIHDFEWTGEWTGRKIDENENIIELNEYIQSIDNLDKWDKQIYFAAVDYWGAEYVDPDDLDDYTLHTDITTDYDLGYYWANESGCYDLDRMGPLANHIDYESFGRDIRLESDGGFTDWGFIERM